MLLTNQSSHMVVPFVLCISSIFFHLFGVQLFPSPPHLIDRHNHIKENSNQTMIRFSGSGKCKLEIYLLAGIPYFVMFIIIHRGLVFLNAVVYWKEWHLIVVLGVKIFYVGFSYNYIVLKFCACVQIYPSGKWSWAMLLFIESSVSEILN